MIKLMIENDYEDSHTSLHMVEVREPAEGEQLDDWFEEVALSETGDGHGANNNLGYCYEATIIEAPQQHAHLIGETREWAGK